MSQQMDATVRAVTERIVERSAPARADYLARIRAAADAGPARGRVACANLAHGFAASDADSKRAPRTHEAQPGDRHVVQRHALGPPAPTRLPRDPAKRRSSAPAGSRRWPGCAAMLRRHHPGPRRRAAVLSQPGRHRDVDRDRAVHDMFDGALMLGVCDAIVPGLLIGALSFGHLPTTFIARRSDGLRPAERRDRRASARLYAEGKVGREELLEAESASYHFGRDDARSAAPRTPPAADGCSASTCRASSFVNPGTPLREALTRAAAGRDRAHPAKSRTPIGEVVDEKAVVNAVRGAARQRRLDEPHHPPRHDRPRRGITPDVGRPVRAVGRGPAAVPDLPQRRGGRESTFPRGRGPSSWCTRC